MKPNCLNIGRRARALLCIILTLNIQYWAGGCGQGMPSLDLQGFPTHVQLTKDHPLSKALVGTTMEGATDLEVDYAMKSFRLIHPDLTKQGWGRLEQQADGWAITEFSFVVNGQGATLAMDPTTKQVTSIFATDGEHWSADTSISRTISSASNSDFVAANPQLIAVDAAMASKGESAFILPIFWFVAYYWLVCSIDTLLCPGFFSIFTFLTVLQSLFTTPPAMDTTPDVVTPVNNSPIAKADAFTTPENTALTGNVLFDNGSGIDSDPDGDALSVTIATNPAKGTAALLTNGSLTYTPNTDFVGVDTFTYLLSDGQGGNANATVTITVTKVNKPPVARNDSFSITFDTTLTGNLFASNGSGADSDPDGDTITISAVNSLAANVGPTLTLPSGGLLTVLAAGTVTYDPNGAFGSISGTETFTYTISDGHGGTSTATVSIFVASD